MKRNWKEESSSHPLPHHMPRSLLDTQIKYSKAHYKKKNHTNDSNSQKELLELPSELIELIAGRLDVVGFCAFGVVCKSWLKIYEGSKEDFLESQAPIAMLMSPHAKQACYLYNMANGNAEKVMLPNLAGRLLVGCSAGYVIIEDMNRQILLVNPLTGKEINYPRAPSLINGKSFFDRIIIGSPMFCKSHFILALNTNKRDFQVFHPMKGRWLFGICGADHWVDIAIFQGKVYFITEKACLGALKVKTKNIMSEFDLLQVRDTPDLNSRDLKLVVLDNKLLMVDFVPEKHLNIHMMDFDAMKWIKVDDLGGHALFWGSKWGSAIRKPGKWGGQSNCVYHLETLSTICNIYSMEAKLINRFPLVENPNTSKLCSYGWYFPNQCLKADYLG